MTEPRYYVGVSRGVELPQGGRIPGGHRGSLWKIWDKEAQRAEPTGEIIKVDNGDIKSELSNAYNIDLYELEIPPGEYYRRMARPGRKSDNLISPSCKDFVDVVASSKGQFTALMRSLDDICRVVHPDGPNLMVYGHEIRNLLLLACTEIEAHWKGILKANGVKGTSTVDYVKLYGPLRLHDYGVKFQDYPWLPEFRPFYGWGDGPNPTQRLSWYAAYNATKHDRESEFARATLASVFDAIAGCFVMLVAQFGEGAEVCGSNGNFDKIALVRRPHWEHGARYLLSMHPKSVFVAGRNFPFI